MIQINDLETQRFGIRCARLVDYEGDIRDALSEARRLKIQFLSARVPATFLSVVNDLESNGFRLKDTLVYFTARLNFKQPSFGHEFRTLNEAAIDRIVSSEDKSRLKSSVAEVADQAFKGYLGHYHSDSQIPEGLADDVYIDWASRTVELSSDYDPVFVEQRNGQVTGFLSLNGAANETSEIVLNAVRPAAQGNGTYGRLLRTAMKYSESSGAAAIEVSTQINNYGVQRVWSRHGFLHTRSAYTLHLWLT